MFELTILSEKYFSNPPPPRVKKTINLPVIVGVANVIRGKHVPGRVVAVVVARSHLNEVFKTNEITTQKYFIDYFFGLHRVTRLLSKVIMNSIIIIGAFLLSALFSRVKNLGLRTQVRNNWHRSSRCVSNVWYRHRKSSGRLKKKSNGYRQDSRWGNLICWLIRRHGRRSSSDVRVLAPQIS